MSELLDPTEQAKAAMQAALRDELTMTQVAGALSRLTNREYFHLWIRMTPVVRNLGHSAEELIAIILGSGLTPQQD